MYSSYRTEFEILWYAEERNLYFEIFWKWNDINWLIIFVYLSSLPVAHLSDAPRRRLVVTGDSARIQDETTENSAWFFNELGV